MAASQHAPRIVSLAGPQQVADTLGFDPEGRLIDSIIIDNRNIYNTDDPRYSGLLFRLANGLHIVTKENIIRHELLFTVGDGLP